MVKRNFSLIAVTAAVALAGCGGDDDGSQRKKGDFVIGNAAPLSGDLQDLGRASQKSADLALQEIRNSIATAGLRGSVSLESADTGSEPGQSVDAIRDLANKGAKCITGPWGPTAVAQAARSVVAEKRLLTISPAATADFIGTLDDRGLVNRTVVKDSDQGVAIANGLAFGLRGAKGKTINISVRGDAYGKGIAETVTRTWKANGGKVGEEVTVAPGRSSYTAEAKRITSGNPDAVVIIDRADTFKQLGRDLAATRGWDPGKAWGTDGLASTALLADPGAKAVRGMRVTVPGVGAGRVGKAFQNRFKDARTFSAQEFDAVILCYLSYVAAKSTDGHKMAAELPALTAPGGRKYSWQQLPGAIQALQAGRDIDYVGASGDLNLNKAGDVTSGAYDIYTLSDKLQVSGNVPVVVND